MIWGKVFGALAGFIAGHGLLGLIAGAIAGHWVDRWLEQRFPNGEQLRRAKIFAEAVTVIAAKLCKADGPVSREEVESFKAQFNFSDNLKPLVARVFDDAKRDPFGFEPFASRVSQAFADEPFLLAEVFGAFYRIAIVDGGPTPPEQDFLERLAGLLGLSYQAFREGPRRPQPSGPDPYAILNVARSVPMSEIKAAWRKLSREHHPDNLIAKGVPSDYVALATRKMAEINAAYDQIRTERGES